MSVRTQAHTKQLNVVYVNILLHKYLYKYFTVIFINTVKSMLPLIDHESTTVQYLYVKKV